MLQSQRDFCTHQAADAGVCVPLITSPALLLTSNAVMLTTGCPLSGLRWLLLVSVNTIENLVFCCNVQGISE